MSLNCTDLVQLSDLLEPEPDIAIVQSDRSSDRTLRDKAIAYLIAAQRYNRYGNQFQSGLWFKVSPKPPL